VVSILLLLSYFLFTVYYQCSLSEKHTHLLFSANEVSERLRDSLKAHRERVGGWKKQREVAGEHRRADDADGGTQKASN